jgi:hypothetical protein
MALTSTQIVELAVQKAKTPGMLLQAGQELNAILQELCQTYDLADARGTFFFNFNQGPNADNTGQGPYLLPSDYLRTQKGKQFYTFNFQPYELISIDQDEWDLLTQQPGFNDFPRNFYVDTSQSPPQEFVWPSPSISSQITVRYFRQMPDIASPEVSTAVPWFRNQKYLITRLAGEMMQISDDTRAAEFLTDDPKINSQGAGVLLRRYLNMKDDPEGRAKTVTLDRRRFGSSAWDRLPNTKVIGW